MQLQRRSQPHPQETPKLDGHLGVCQMEAGGRGQAFLPPLGLTIGGGLLFAVGIALARWLLGGQGDAQTGAHLSHQKPHPWQLEGQEDVDPQRGSGQLTVVLP